MAVESTETLITIILALPVLMFVVPFFGELSFLLRRNPPVCQLQKGQLIVRGPFRTHRFSLSDLRVSTYGKRSIIGSLTLSNGSKRLTLTDFDLTRKGRTELLALLGRS